MGASTFSKPVTTTLPLTLGLSHWDVGFSMDKLVRAETPRGSFAHLFMGVVITGLLKEKLRSLLYALSREELLGAHVVAGRGGGVLLPQGPIGAFWTRRLNHLGRLVLLTCRVGRLTVVIGSATVASKSRYAAGWTALLPHCLCCS